MIVIATKHEMRAEKSQTLTNLLPPQAEKRKIKKAPNPLDKVATGGGMLYLINKRKHTPMKRKCRIITILCLLVFATSVFVGCGKDGARDPHAFDSVKSEQVTEEEWKAAFDTFSSTTNVSCDYRQTEIYGEREAAEYGLKAGDKDVMKMNVCMDDVVAHGYNGYAYHNGVLDTHFPDEYETAKYEFRWDEDNIAWVRRDKGLTDIEGGYFDNGKVNLVVGIGLDDIFFENDLSDAYDKFSYDEKQFAYVYVKCFTDEYREIFTIKFTDGKIAYISYCEDDSITGGNTTEQEWVFYDYGTTTVTLPAEWEERSDEWWNEND